MAGLEAAGSRWKRCGGEIDECWMVGRGEDE